MKKIIIHENEKGLLFKNGKLARMLEAGRHYIFHGSEIEILPVHLPLSSGHCALDLLLKHPEIARKITVVSVSDRQLALHFVDGSFSEVLRSGTFAFWNTCAKHTFQLVDISTPVVSADVPAYLFPLLPTDCYRRIEVADYQKARLYFDQKLVKILEGGTYYFWRNQVSIDVSFVDTRLTWLNVTGQEILTRDKVGLRINFVCSYRITDCIRVLTEVDDYQEQLHIAAQMALREYVGRQKLDEILENREEISDYVIARLREKAPGLYVEIRDGGVKDLILPGEIRSIMNTVLVAEKRAQANVITRREEVASTRSLLNTAKLMEENKTLMRLKEMEYLERICENVGSIRLSGTGDLLTQLGNLFHGQPG